MFKSAKTLDMSMYKWQLPVKQSNITDTDWIHPKAKYHCFDKFGHSLCGSYWQDIYYFETDIEYSNIENKKELENFKCKKCKKIFEELKNKKFVGENIGGTRIFKGKISS